MLANGQLDKKLHELSLPQLQSLPEASNFFEWFDSITKDISSELKNVHLQILVNAVVPQLPQDFIPSTILRGLTSLNLTNESSI
jgi:hypothetical protein